MQVVPGASPSMQDDSLFGPGLDGSASLSGDTVLSAGSPVMLYDDLAGAGGFTLKYAVTDYFGLIHVAGTLTLTGGFAISAMARGPGTLNPSSPSTSGIAGGNGAGAIYVFARRVDDGDGEITAAGGSGSATGENVGGNAGTNTAAGTSQSQIWWGGGPVYQSTGPVNGGNPTGGSPGGGGAASNVVRTTAASIPGAVRFRMKSWAALLGWSLPLRLTTEAVNGSTSPWMAYSQAGAIGSTGLAYGDGSTVIGGGGAGGGAGIYGNGAAGTSSEQDVNPTPGSTVSGDGGSGGAGGGVAALISNYVGSGIVVSARGGKGGNAGVGVGDLNTLKSGRGGAGGGGLAICAAQEGSPATATANGGDAGDGAGTANTPENGLAGLVYRRAAA